MKSSTPPLQFTSPMRNPPTDVCLRGKYANSIPVIRNSIFSSNTVLSRSCPPTQSRPPNPPFCDAPPPHRRALPVTNVPPSPISTPCFPSEREKIPRTTQNPVSARVSSPPIRLCRCSPTEMSCPPVPRRSLSCPPSPWRPPRRVVPGPLPVPESIPPTTYLA